MGTRGIFIKKLNLLNSMKSLRTMNNLMTLAQLKITEVEFWFLMICLVLHKMPVNLFLKNGDKMIWIPNIYLNHLLNCQNNQLKRQMTYCFCFGKCWRMLRSFTGIVQELIRLRVNLNNYVLKHGKKLMYFLIQRTKKKVERNCRIHYDRPST